ncbi:GNAT family N-acetyltransferase [Cohnella hashimotonis]|uniref:GNAT family N-acetyltransferase n=1 Tax=Cohnella hashimotonis TaxID=2826895 RepID=A0ABT6TEI0_9BACL|nr:GNAT family N-acetyltransferase [Cohnella hashimotonis]MDI4645227.1 GNAT family N-acetyltransferase [Cohnella hashimotonis]
MDVSDVSLTRASIHEASIIHEMQVKAFLPLLQKYQDYDTSPANEPVERIVSRLNQPITDYYFIMMSSISVGAVRIVRLQNNAFRVSPIFILPEYQGLGIAQKVFELLERQYEAARRWELDTILQERGNCYLYEKLGYRRTGKSEVINDKMTIVFYEKPMSDCAEQWDIL